jgi:hypothetical protein
MLFSQMATSSISFLLGSGFSVPEGLPSVSTINRRLSELKEANFYLFSDQTAGFYYSDERDPNAWMPSSFLDRLFAQEFTAFYVKEFLNGRIEDYNYEVFYDFISDFLQFKMNADKIHTFCESFRESNIKDKVYKYDDLNWVWRFKRILNQLIADLLFKPKYYEDVGYGNYPTYGGFFGWLRELLKVNIVNIHSLNHDLFFDFMASHLSDLWQHYTDGYTQYGSSYYGDVSVDFHTERGNVHKEYKVRLKYYNGKYENTLRLFKLHGSIDSYTVHLSGTTEDIRIKKDFRVREFLKERFDEGTQKYIYEKPHTETYPDFLTGTTEKIRQYNIPFYENLFSHFKTNLLAASKLVVVGYGFQDKGINDFLEKYYLIYHKPMIVIDIRKPECDLLKSYESQVQYMLQGIVGHNYTEYMQLL